MTVDDLPAVRAADARIFSRPDAPAKRTLGNLAAHHAMGPSSSFVAVSDTGTVVGYLFARLWGHWGWIGGTGVLPEHRRSGIGTQLLDAAVHYLRGQHCMGIGLELSPERLAALGMAIKAGFRTMTPTVTLSRALDPTATHTAHHFTSVRKESSLDIFRQISRVALPGKDYTAEAVNAISFAWGDVLAMPAQQGPLAGVIIRTKPIYDDQPASPTLHVHALVATPEGRCALRGIVASLDAYASQKKLTSVELTLNTADAVSTTWLIANGFRVHSTMLRLMVHGEYPCPPGLDMSRWAM